MPVPRDIDGYLSRRFYDPKSPGSFTSVSKLHAVIKREGRYDIPLDRIKKWGEGQDILSLHKATGRKPLQYRKIVAPGSNHLWDTDILVLSGTRFRKANEGYSYILVTVDVFSRYCRARALKTKGAKDVSEAFADILEKSRIKPRFIRSDRGKEYENVLVKNLFIREGIKHYFCTTETKASFSEALIKTLKRKLFQTFQKRNHYGYIHDLQDIVSSYNRTVHSAIGRPPYDVSARNEKEVWFYQYVTNSDHYKKTLLNSLRRTERKKKRPIFKYRLGDTVRVAYFARKPFTRAYDQLFSGEIFTIRDRKVAGGIPLYYLNDYAEEKVEGNFYDSELTRVDLDPEAYFKIEKVLKTRKRNGVTENLVKWQSWPSKYNSWVEARTIKHLRRTT